MIHGGCMNRKNLNVHRIVIVLLATGNAAATLLYNRLLMLIRRCNMQSTINLDAVLVRPAGISLEEGMAALKCDTKRLLRTKSETMSYLCEETVTYGEVLATVVGLVALMAVMALSGFIAGGEVM